MKKNALVLAPLCMLAACAPLHTPYTSPLAGAGVPPVFVFADAGAYSNSPGSIRNGKWWQSFGDAQLDRLIEAALLRNNDLAAAAIKLRRARLSAGIAADNLQPRLDAGADLGYDRRLRGARDSRRHNSLRASLSYELDLWGRLGSLSDAAEWEMQATEQDRESAALALIGMVAGLYWQGGYLNQSIALGEQSIAYAERTAALTRMRYLAGAASRLESVEALQNVAGQRAAQTQLRQQQVENANALAILFDRAPESDMSAFAGELPACLPDYPLPAITPDLPAAVLARRPDLRAAEHRLRAALADTDALRAGYYPQFTLTGALGASSGSLHDVLRNPIASLGLGLTLPFLNLDRSRLDIAVSRADYDIAVVDFRQSLYSALRDVENALSAQAQYEKQGEMQRQRLDAAREAERLYEIRYRAGAVALNVFLDAQEKRRNAEIAVAGNRLDALNNRMTLYLALGGGGVAAAPPGP